MDENREKIPGAGGEASRRRESSGPEAVEADACRCKEAKEMTPAELLKAMLRDLAFWKKKDA